MHKRKYHLTMHAHKKMKKRSVGEQWMHKDKTECETEQTFGAGVKLV